MREISDAPNSIEKLMLTDLAVMANSSTTNLSVVYVSYFSLETFQLKAYKSIHPRKRNKTKPASLLKE